MLQCRILPSGDFLHAHVSVALPGTASWASSPPKACPSKPTQPLSRLPSERIPACLQHCHKRALFQQQGPAAPLKGKSPRSWCRIHNKTMHPKMFTFLLSGITTQSWPVFTTTFFHHLSHFLLALGTHPVGLTLGVVLVGQMS